MCSFLTLIYLIIFIRIILCFSNIAGWIILYRETISFIRQKIKERCDSSHILVATEMVFIIRDGGEMSAVVTMVLPLIVNVAVVVIFFGLY